MGTENFIYFFTVCGFFIGLMFSVLNFSDPTDIMIYTCGITLFFYLFMHIVAINFIDFSKFGKMIFDKREHEEISNYFIKELDLRENRLDSMLLELDKMNKKYKELIEAEAETNAVVENENENADEYEKAA